MRLNHVYCVTSHDQLTDTVQRLGSRLGSTFVDGGIHRTPLAEIEKIVIADNDQLADSWFKDEILASLGDVNIE